MTISSAVLALFLAFPGALAVPQPAEAPDECYLAVNLARTARLSHRVGLLETEDRFKQQAHDIVTRAVVAAAGDCDNLQSPRAAALGIAVGWILPQENCANLMNHLIQAFVETSPDYPPPFVPDNPPWADDLGASFFRILWEKTNKIGCAITNGCERSLFVCTFDRRVTAGDVVFSPNVYASILARHAAKIDFSTLTKDDLNTGLELPEEIPPKKSGSSRQDLSVLWLAMASAFSLATVW